MSNTQFPGSQGPSCKPVLGHGPAKMQAVEWHLEQQSSTKNALMDFTFSSCSFVMFVVNKNFHTVFINSID